MEGVFSGVPSSNIDHFFSNLVVFDSSMPHTPTRLSPITFMDYLIRNSIMCLNQEQVYDAACRFWRHYHDMSPETLKSTQKPYRMSLCEETHAGWNTLIDFFNRVLNVQKFEGNPWYQMHYLSHVCYLFYHTKYKDTDSKACHRAIFHEIMMPIMYEPVIPANYTFLPIINAFDFRFPERIAVLCGKVSDFIESHSARTMDHKKYDLERLTILQNIIREGLQNVYNEKYNEGKWKAALVQCLTKFSVINADVHACEAYDVFERDGMKCCAVLNQLGKVKRFYENNTFAEDPDSVIDELLDGFKLCSDGLESYNIPSEKVEKKK